MRLSFALVLFFLCLAGIVALKLLTAVPEGDTTRPPERLISTGEFLYLSNAEADNLAIQDYLHKR